MMVKTTYSFIWDIYMDWGLFRSNERGDENRFLRPKINYQHSFYYWAIFSDFVLRYIWILFLFNYGTKDSSFNQLNIMFALAVGGAGVHAHAAGVHVGDGVDHTNTAAGTDSATVAALRKQVADFEQSERAGALAREAAAREQAAMRQQLAELTAKLERIKNQPAPALASP